MNNLCRFVLPTLLVICLFLLAACGATTSPPPQVEETVTIDKSFQSQVSPVPTIPPYLCGAWVSNYSPGAYSTITIYARITKNTAAVNGARATAVAHFENGSVTLSQQPVSDRGGYVNFTLPLQGRQPRQVPGLIEVTFTVGNTKVTCPQTFFTPT